MPPRLPNGVLGTGRYGCVIAPPLPCDGAVVPRGSVTKLLLPQTRGSWDDEENEELLGALAEVDPTQHWFVFPTLTHAACAPRPLRELAAGTQASLRACWDMKEGKDDDDDDDGSRSQGSRSRSGSGGSSPRRRGGSSSPRPRTGGGGGSVADRPALDVRASPLPDNTRHLRYVFMPRLTPLRRATVNSVTALGRTLRAALARLHAAGIAHRDVSINNVMTGADGRGRLIDWGLATVRASLADCARDDEMLDAVIAELLARAKQQQQSEGRRRRMR